MKENTKPLIIFDTDMDTDCDDAGALAIIFEYVKREKAELLAICCDAADKYSPGTCEVLCNWYGIHPPIGAQYDASYPEEETDRYVRYRNHRKTLPDDIYYKIPMAKLSGKLDTDYPSSAEVYRKVLSEAEDDSVTVVAVGFFTAIEELFRTGPDKYSELDGLTLFNKKVKCVVSMGCATYPENSNYNFNYNMDRVGAKAFFDKCAKSIYVSPEGMDVITGSSFTEKLELGHPLRTIYEIYNQGPNKGRSSWDLIASLYALEPENPIFRTEGHGCVRYDDSCNRTYWQEKDYPRMDYEMLTNISVSEMEQLLEKKMLGEF